MRQLVLQCPTQDYHDHSRRRNPPTPLHHHLFIPSPPPAETAPNNFEPMRSRPRCSSARRRPPSRARAQVLTPEGPFAGHGTRVVTLLPRHAVCNLLPRPILVGQRGCVAWGARAPSA